MVFLGTLSATAAWRAAGAFRVGARLPQSGRARGPGASSVAPRASSVAEPEVAATGGAAGATSPAATHPAFELVREDRVAEFGAAAALYRHKRSGAELLSLATDDDNKCFGITFRTPPPDSTGVPHILVRRGSDEERYLPLCPPIF